MGDLLVCSADGNPTPSYIWTDTTGRSKAIHGSNLMIENEMKSDQHHSFNCSAYNTVLGVTWYISETVTFSVRGKVRPTCTWQHTSIQPLILEHRITINSFIHYEPFYSTPSCDYSGALSIMAKKGELLDEHKKS